MKKLLVLFVAALAVLAIACVERPEEPVCAEGQITVTPAVWNEGTPATVGQCHVVVRGIDMSGYYKHDGNSANCSLKNDEKWRRWIWPYPPTTAQGAWTPGTPATDGYWTPPVCQDPVPDPVCEDPLANNIGLPLPCTYDPPPVLCEDEAATNYGQEGECQYPEPTPDPPKHCEVQGVMWYQCESGEWLYGSGILRDCPWCGGMNGNRVVKESYDCGKHWTYYYNGERTDLDFSWLGRYPCTTAGCYQ